MALIIALILGGILLGLWSLDAGAAGAYDRQVRARRAGEDEFDRLYTDPELEKTLREFIDDEDTYEQVREAVSTALKGVSSWHTWTGLLSTRQREYYMLNKDKDRKEARKRMERDHITALDVLLAQRGKISLDGAHYGYKAYLGNDAKGYRKALYEYAERIMTIAHQNGCTAKLVCMEHSGFRYVWEGSSASTWPTASFKPFDRKLIEDKFAGVKLEDL